MTKPVVVIEPAPDAPGILHSDDKAWKHGPVPKHDVGHEVSEPPDPPIPDNAPKTD